MLNTEQWGSRPARNAIEVVFMKTLTYMIAQLTRTMLGTFDNDAKACYDRIVFALWSLRSQQMGMPEEACEFLGLFYRMVEYHLKTSNGVSDEFYQCMVELALYGSGQGAKPSPAAWLKLSTLLMDCMPEKA